MGMGEKGKGENGHGGVAQGKSEHWGKGEGEIGHVGVAQGKSGHGGKGERGEWLRVRVCMGEWLRVRMGMGSGSG